MFLLQISRLCRQTEKWLSRVSIFFRPHHTYGLGYSGIEWGWIHIGLSLEKFSADLESIYLRTALLAILCILSASIFSFVFARRLSRPIYDLNDVTRRVARGDLVARASITSRDELGSLANSFNVMADNLQGARDELEQRVVERTSELESARQRIQHLLTSSPAVIYSCESRSPYTITFISENVQKMLGFEAREFLEKPAFWLNQIHVEDLPGVMDSLSAAASKGQQVLEFRILDKVGVYRWVHNELRLARDVKGRRQEFVGSLTDITQQKQAEAAQAQAELELENQRALSMRSDRLRSLGEMAAGIAHELNQPLVGVRGLAEHILIGIDRGWELSKEKLVDRATRIVEQADRMVHIIEHVRMFAREAGKPEMSPVQVNDVVTSAVEMLNAQFHSHDVDLKCELGEGLPSVMANPFSLEEVVLNLLNNARDAVEEAATGDTGAAHREVLVRTGQGSRERVPQVRIEVQDNGVGIPEDIAKKVFDPFFTTKAPDRGTGLGLAISRSIVEEFGGSLRISSGSGEGTTAVISLPVQSTNGR
jgi:PAS domain S-box-containing protein